MPQIVPAHQPVVNLAKASQTIAVSDPHCDTPGCGARAVVGATVDVHFAVPFPRESDVQWSHTTVYLACLPCYGRLRRLQTEAIAEIVAVEAV